MGVLMAAGAGANALQGAQNASLARDAQSRNLLMTGQSARGDLFAGWTSLGIRRAQALRETAQSIQGISDRAALMSSTASVGAAEAGVGGNSVASVLNDYERTSLIEQDRKLRDMDYMDQAIDEQARSMRARAQARIYGAIGAPIQKPSLLGSLLHMGSAGAGGFFGAGGKLGGGGGFDFGSPVSNPSGAQSLPGFSGQGTPAFAGGLA